MVDTTLGQALFATTAAVAVSQIIVKAVHDLRMRAQAKRMALYNEKPTPESETLFPPKHPDIAANAEDTVVKKKKADPLNYSLKEQRQHRQEQHERTERYIKLAVGIIFSLVILVPCLYLLITSHDQEQVKWSQSTVALILDYWLKAIT